MKISAACCCILASTLPPLLAGEVVGGWGSKTCGIPLQGCQSHSHLAFMPPARTPAIHGRDGAIPRHSAACSLLRRHSPSPAHGEGAGGGGRRPTSTSCDRPALTRRPKPWTTTPGDTRHTSHQRAMWYPSCGRSPQPLSRAPLGDLPWPAHAPARAPAASRETPDAPAPWGARRRPRMHRVKTHRGG